MKDTFFIALQRLAPQHLISRLIGLIASSNIPLIKNMFIQWFVKRYNIDMSIAAEEDPLAYPSFNAFFTRALKTNARSIDADLNTIVCPADGSISQIGSIKSDRIFQAKGQSFSTLELLGGDAEEASRYQDGSFATIYLSPKDYHRVHIPNAGTLIKMTHIPGDLFSVNTVTAENVPRLFARNERVACHFQTDCGPMVVVLVGAMIVASIETTWAGLVTPIKKQIRSINYTQDAKNIHFLKGEEMGRFLLGSTAVVLFAKDAISWKHEFEAGDTVVMGQALGTKAS